MVLRHIIKAAGGKNKGALDPRHQKNSAAPENNPSQAVQGSERKTAKEALVAVLSIFGLEAFDADDQEASETTASFRSWARHVETGLPFEKLRARYPLFSRVSGIPGGAQFDLIVKAFAEHRKSERETVLQIRRQARRLIWALADRLKAEADQGGKDLTECHALFVRMRDLVVRHQSGALDQAVTDSLDALELLLRRTAERHALSVQQLQAQMKEIQKELNQRFEESRLDPLTRLYNRRTFDEELTRLVDECTYSRTPAVMVVIDIDHFKRVNDTFGHAGGDEVLRQVARLCSHSFLTRTDLVARYGGEEFVVLMRGESTSSARERVLAFRKALQGADITFQGEKIPVTVSVGLAGWKSGEAPDKWFERADKAMYQAKTTGRDRIIAA